uniref:Uncharacterized protein n=1 Tax=Siphoviridae sp. ctYh54 TaxID=2826379 RepID=A0A8S5MEH4_9CAUD|nr:MAG TPA: hypothetical protein [Siphoviridae sp. ctYh54]
MHQFGQFGSDHSPGLLGDRTPFLWLIRASFLRV